MLSAFAARTENEASLTIRLLSIVTSERVVKDTAPKGTPNKGDVVYQRSALRNSVEQFGKPRGAVVGSDFGL